MAIANTVSAVEGFDERIKVVEEEASRLELTLAETEAVDALKFGGSRLTAALLTSAQIALSLWALGCVVAALSKDNDAPPMWRIVWLGMAGASGFGAWLAWRKTRLILANQATTHRDATVESRLQFLRQEIANLKQKKRALLLAHSEEVSGRDDVLNDSFAGKVGGDMKECPQCAEYVKARARKCRYCGFDFPQIVES